MQQKKKPAWMNRSSAMGQHEQQMELKKAEEAKSRKAATAVLERHASRTHHGQHSTETSGQ